MCAKSISRPSLLPVSPSLMGAEQDIYLPRKGHPKKKFDTPLTLQIQCHQYYSDCTMPRGSWLS